VLDPLPAFPAPSRPHRGRLPLALRQPLGHAHTNRPPGGFGSACACPPALRSAGAGRRCPCELGADVVGRRVGGGPGPARPPPCRAAMDPAARKAAIRTSCFMGGLRRNVSLDAVPSQRSVPDLKPAPDAVFPRSEDAHATFARLGQGRRGPQSGPSPACGGRACPGLDPGWRRSRRKGAAACVGAWGRPLHHAWHSPPPPQAGEDADCTLRIPPPDTAISGPTPCPARRGGAFAGTLMPGPWRGLILGASKPKDTPWISSLPSSPSRPVMPP